MLKKNYLWPCLNLILSGFLRHIQFSGFCSVVRRSSELTHSSFHTLTHTSTNPCSSKSLSSPILNLLWHDKSSILVVFQSCPQKKTNTRSEPVFQAVAQRRISRCFSEETKEKWVKTTPFLETSDVLLCCHSRWRSRWGRSSDQTHQWTSSRAGFFEHVFWTRLISVTHWVWQ